MGRSLLKGFELFNLPSGLRGLILGIVQIILVYQVLWRPVTECCGRQRPIRSAEMGYSLGHRSPGECDWIKRLEIYLGLEEFGGRQARRNPKDYGHGVN